YFDEDWHGMVLAEEKNEVYPETYLNHHFPASDIPAQARRLFTLNRLRMIPDVNYRPAPLVPAINPDTDVPLNMTQALLRDVSPVHLEYLRNMGVAASLTISLINNGRLGGLITCHHATPRKVPHLVRLRCKVLGELASATITGIERRQSDRLQQQRKADQALIFEQLASAPSIRDGLRAAEQHLLHFLQADSLLIQFAGHQKIGRASCRERGSSSVAAASTWSKTENHTYAT